MLMRPESGDLEAAAMKKVGWRLIPFLMLCYFIAYIDRVNAGFAALTMNKDVGLTATAFGIGGGLFYVAYVIFEIPSNLALEKFGARRWISRIMVTWGLVGIGSAFVTDAYSFWIARFLLGAAEAGFFPGVILYLTYWFPKAYRARIVAMFMVAVPLSSFLGSPLAAGLLALNGVLGFKGWQWLLAVEAVPAVLLGLFTLWYLPSKPSEATFLSEEEKAWLANRLQSEAQEGGASTSKHGRILSALANKQVWIFAIIYSGLSATSNALSLWMPQILKSFGLSNSETAILNMVPFGIASIAMIYWGFRADKKNDRVLSTALPMALSTAAVLLTLITSSLTLTLFLLVLVLVGNYTTKGPFFALATERLPVSITAAGVAAINTIAHLSAGGVTSIIGFVRDATGSFPIALLPLCLLTGVGCVLVLMVGRTRGKEA